MEIEQPATGETWERPEGVWTEREQRMSMLPCTQNANQPAQSWYDFGKSRLERLGKLLPRTS